LAFEVAVQIRFQYASYRASLQNVSRQCKKTETNRQFAT